MIKVFFLILVLTFLTIYVYKASNNLGILVFFYFIFETVFFVSTKEGLKIPGIPLSSMTSIDIFGFLLIPILITKLLSGHYKGLLNSTIGRIVFIYYFANLVILFISIYTFGLKTIQGYRYHIHYFNLLIVLAGYDYKKNNIEYFFKLLRGLVIATIIIYFLRLFGLINMPVGEYGVDASAEYSKYRYIINDQVLVLIFFYIYVSKLRFFKFQISSFDKILSLFSLGLIITSTQRMLTIIFLLYLIYEFFSSPRKGLLQFVLLIALLFGLFYFTPKGFINSLQNAFAVVLYNFKESNAGAKLADIPASIAYMLEKGQWLFGRFYQKEVFVRSFAYFSSFETRPIHNLFITRFVIGGLFLAIPMLVLWFYLIFSKFKTLISRKEYDFFSQISVLWLISLFLFNNSSAVGVFNAVILGYSILLHKKSIYIHSIFPFKNDISKKAQSQFLGN